MEDKNGKYIKGRDLSEENIDQLAKNNIAKDELITTNKVQGTLSISAKKTENNTKDEIENKEVSKTVIKEDLKALEENTKDEDNTKDEIKNKQVPKTAIKEDLKAKEDNTKDKIENKEVPKTVFKKELTPDLIKKEFDKINPENKVIKTNSDTTQIPIGKSNQTIQKPLDVKPKVKPKKEIPIEKKPFIEFINEHLIPEIINEFKNRGKIIDVINIKKTNRPISEDICWVIYCEVHETCNFWLSFEKDDITSLKSFSLCKNYEKPSIIESFLIDEKKITLKLIISRILQRLNGQKLIGAN